MDTLSSLTGNKIALLIDFDNVILGVDDPGFDIELVVNAMRSRGVVVMGRAYGDWYRHHRHRRKLMEQGIELVETPVFGPLIKNSADIRIVLDGFEIAMSQAHIDTFCLVSGDSDFLPLIKKLQYLGKTVIVIAGIKFTSDLIRRNCNEYIAYENLFAESLGTTEDVTQIDGAFHLLARSIDTLNERGMDVRSSSVKQMMMQLNPAFSERTFGCSQFKQFLDRAVRATIIRLETRNGGAGEASVYLLEEAKEALYETAAQAVAALPTITRDSTREEVRAVAREAANQMGASQNSGARETEKSRESAAARRDLTTARRSGRKFSGRAGRVEKTDGAETPPLDTAIAPLEAIGNDEAVAAAEGFVNVLAQRTDLRRGRLRFSARSGVARQDALASSTPEIDCTPEAAPVIDESQQQTGDQTPEIVEEGATKKRASRRGGRGRKKKDEAPATENETEGTASPEFLAETVAEENVSAAVAETTPEIAASETETKSAVEETPSEEAPPRAKRLRAKKPRVAKVEKETVPENAVQENATPKNAAPKVATPKIAPAIEEPVKSAPEVVADSTAEAASETETVEKKPRRRGGVKRTSARKKKDGEETADSA